jgi:hypothetical protein
MSFNNSLKGVLHVNGTSAAGAAGTTSEQTLMTYTLPAGALKRNGQNLRIRAWGLTGANGNNKIFKLYFGATSVSSGTITGSGKVVALQLDVIRLADASQTILATGQQDATALANANTAGTDDHTGAIVIKLTGTGATSGDDCVAKGLIVEMGMEA